MRTLLALFLLIMLACAAMVVADEADKPWFDMQNCVFCKEVAAQPGLVDHMRHEYHNLHNGVLSITYIDADYRDEFANMQAAMMKVASGMNPTNMPPMCQHCSKIGEFYMKGVKMEEVKSAEAILVVYSHSDAEMIKDIQAFGARTAEETAKHFAALKEK